MKKLFWPVFSAFMIVASIAGAQLVNVDRHVKTQMLTDDTQLQFGNLPDVLCEYDSAQTNDALVCGLSAESERFILTQKADMSTNFGLSDLNSPAMSIMSAAGTKSVSIYHDGTNAIIDVDGGGVVSFPDGISASVSPDGMMSFATGAAVTAASYQMGRDADGTNQLHFNVPTGASFEFSVNDVARLIMSSTVANFQTTGILTANVNAAGASSDAISVAGTLGIMDGSDTYNAVNINLIDVNHTGVTNAVNGISIAGITADADATESAIKLGNGWDVGLDAGNNTITTTATNVAGGSKTPVAVTSAIGIMDGSDSYNGLLITLTNANHTGVTNVVNGVSIPGITADADATETALLIGNGWDVSLNAGNGAINSTGPVNVASVLATTTIQSSNTTTIGWSVVAGANTACTTTCTNACVMGQDSGATNAIVDCANAIADVCVCAGAN